MFGPSSPPCRVARLDLFERVFQRRGAVEAGTLKRRLGVAPGASVRSAWGAWGENCEVRTAGVKG